MNDEKLVRQCRKGNRKAQQILYERFDEPMFRIVWRYIRDRQDAEDIHLQAFFKVFKSISNFEYRGEGSLFGWIRRIVVNEALMFLRKKRFEWVPVDEARTEETDVRPDDGLKAEDIIRVVRELPTGFRTVFNLYAVEGYSHKEIAEMLDISEGTSKSQLSRARQLLRERLTQLENHHEKGKYRQSC